MADHISSVSIPSSALLDRRLSALEAIVRHMKVEYGLTYSEIARLLNRDDRTIWTVFKRASKKLENVK